MLYVSVSHSILLFKRNCRHKEMKCKEMGKQNRNRQNYMSDIAWKYVANAIRRVLKKCSGRYVRNSQGSAVK